MGQKYPNLSPYVYGANNPIVVVDFDGRDIIVLHAPKGANGMGHAAALIGNDKTGWYLYSKNGTTWTGGAAGPSNKNPESGLYFKTLEDFANSESNFNLESGEVQYEGAYQIATTAEQDMEMMKAASETVEEWYDVTSCTSTNCIDVPSAALEAVGLDPGGSNPIPNERYPKIKENNPQGSDATHKIQASKETREKRKKEAEQRRDAAQKKKIDELKKRKQEELERNRDRQ